MIGEYREVPQTSTTDEGTIRLYRSLFAVQFISVLIIVVCGLTATSSFG